KIKRQVDREVKDIRAVGRRPVTRHQHLGDEATARSHHRERVKIEADRELLFQGPSWILKNRSCRYWQTGSANHKVTNERTTAAAAPVIQTARREIPLRVSATIISAVKALSRLRTPAMRKKPSRGIRKIGNAIPPINPPR